MQRRIMVSLALGTVLVLGAIASPAQAGRATRSNSGRAVHTVKAGHVVSARPASVAAFKQFATPVAKYVNSTCVIDLSTIPDFTIVSSVTGCGVTVTFSVPLEKRSVPASWNTWGSPPDTEGASPNILYTSGATDVTLTYSKTSRRIGIEAEPDLFQVETMSATFRNKKGKTVGSVSRDVDGSAGARLFAGQTGKLKAQWVKSIEITNLVGDDFAIAQIRVS